MKYPLLHERSREGRGCMRPGLSAVPPAQDLPPVFTRKTEAPLPGLSEPELVRHYTGLAARNYGIDTGFYPLGSCTMKYNPVLNEDIAALKGFTHVHPLQPDTTVQGTLELMHRLLSALCALTGMDWGTLQPCAGAHGEYTGMKMFRAWFDSRGETGRTRIIVPDSSHGTNPASAHIAGFEVEEIRSGKDGRIDPEVLRSLCDEKLAGIMLTNPNTLGLYETDILDISDMVHRAGGLLYYDGANMNAIMGKCRPGDMGFDAVHLNLHKTFSTPHGGGGPGAGPVLVRDRLSPFLPGPVITKTREGYSLAGKSSKSTGRVSGFHGNISVLVRAYAYILRMGADGLERASELAVLNANYLLARLSGIFSSASGASCMHEFVLSAKDYREKYGISAGDIAKALIDRGIHPPTVYFPLIVPEALMIEPTETEVKETLDSFCDALIDIVETAKSKPSLLHEAPRHAQIARADETLAARTPRVRWGGKNK